jgi:hypothetical protein
MTNTAHTARVIGSKVWDLALKASEPNTLEVSTSIVIAGRTYKITLEER